MSLISTLGALRGQRDNNVTHAPTAEVPKSDTWSAIQYLGALFGALPGIMTISDSVGTTALGLARKAERDAKTASGQAALQAQVFN